MRVSFFFTSSGNFTETLKKSPPSKESGDRPQETPNRHFWTTTKDGRQNTLLLLTDTRTQTTERLLDEQVSIQAAKLGAGRSPATRGPLVAVCRFLLGLLHELVHLRAYSQNLFLRTFLEPAEGGGGGARVGVGEGGGGVKSFGIVF